MKKIFILILVSMLLTGCTRAPYNDYSKFKIVERYKDGYEIVDKDTGYGYFIFYEGKGSSALPLFDEYGNPYKENGWRDYGE